MKEKMMILFAFLFLFSMTACDRDSEAPSEVPSTACTITQPTTEATTVPTTVPETIPTVPSLNMEAGAYPLKYEDAENNTDMDFYLFIPENAVENMPLIIFLHGDGEVGRFALLENNSMMVCVREIYGVSFPFIAIAPCTRSETWTGWTIPDTLLKLIEDVVGTYHIDPEHIIITGHSRGAVGVWHMINTHGDYFSAAVPVSCICWEDLNFDVITQVPIKAFCGNYEDYERWYSNLMRKQIDEIVQAGGDAEFILHQGATHVQTPGLSYTEELFQWMLAQ